VSVHDPSVIRVGSVNYVFGSHGAAAKTSDWMNWTLVADGVTAANPLFNNVLTALAETFAWSQVTDLWAPDVALLDDGRYALYYCSCRGDSPLSALGVAYANAVEGPYVNAGIVLRSGMVGASEDGSTYNARVHPNVVDPQVFRDAAGVMWMIYGSYSGGIFILKLDKASGKPVAGQGYGKHLMGGNHARIEGAYVLFVPESNWYYLFTSFGGLDAAGGYNLRVARSRNPDGPYVDGAGTDMANVKANAALPLFDDASIVPHGQKLMGNHQWALATGETGTAPGYVSAGHNSAYRDAATGQLFLIFHSRFPGQGELHQVRVHSLFVNADGWLVAAPLRYVTANAVSPAPASGVTAADAAGSYKFLNHAKDMAATVKPSGALTLTAAGRASGAALGTWTHDGNNGVTLTLDGVRYSGVLSRQWNANAGAFVVSFSAQSLSGVSVWGIRTGA
jgi:arabinan endo-1,5-alpha-L-arabinosidase